ncbi:MAG: LytR C-terminal domain-containing protein [Pseudomonadota bacterium]|nr:LytR C-terminal domain-containing protein [Pseudomonadota bacterium]
MGYRGAIIALLCGAALSGCSSEPAIEVRPVGVSARGAAKSGLLAHGHAALAMGNVGLALQEFRQSLRVDPGSTGALSGIALCYDAMGRADLARRYYEEALALAPADLSLLRQYAASLARHGAVSEAQAVTSEIALRSMAPAAQWVIAPAPVAHAAAAPTTAPPLPDLSVASPSSHSHLATNDSQPAAVRPKVRIERLSLGEIALVTTGVPLWVRLPAPSQIRSVRLLNAARLQGFAARHRQLLQGAGWRSVAIGDAPHIRKSSLVLYPEGQRGEARRLANKLRIAAIHRETRTDILVLLGRDLG